MSQTIMELWNGNITPCEFCGAHDREAKKLFGLMERNREALCGTLHTDQAEAFQKYIDASDEYLMRMLELAFYEGFSLGVKLSMEALQQH